MGGSRKVLVAIDGSKHSDFTFQWYVDNMLHDEDFVYLAWNATPNAATFGTVNLMTGDPDLISKMIHEQRNHIETTVNHLKTKLREFKLKGQVLQLHGSKPGEAIIEAADKVDVDLIVVGGRGHNTLRRTFLGSVSDYIIHHAHKPVIVCKMEQPNK